MNTLDIILKYREAIADGLSVTVRLCLFIWGVGISVGTLSGYARNKWPTTIGRVLGIIGFVATGIPILVLLYWLHYPLQAYLGVVIDPFWTAVAALSFVNAVAVSDTVSTALRDFPEQYMTAARVCGLSTYKTVLSIQLPLILRQVVPPVLTLQVYMLQATLFASLISVQEIFRVAQSINAQEYRPIEVYSSLALFFLLICLPLNGIALFLRKRFTRDISEV